MKKYNSIDGRIHTNQPVVVYYQDGNKEDEKCREKA